MKPKQIVIAIDSFKGSLSSLGAGNIVAAAAHRVFPDCLAHVYPLADGGEGTVDALAHGLGGEIVPVTVTGPLGEKIPSRFGCLPDRHMAIIVSRALVPQAASALRSPRSSAAR